MQYMNIPVDLLDSVEFVGSEPIDRATWFCLLKFCTSQETGGVILDCLEWGDRKWQQLCRVTKDEVLRNCSLWQWETGSIHVWGYQIDQERRVQSNRISGSKKSEAKTIAARQNGQRGGRPKNDSGNAQSKSKEKKNISSSEKHPAKTKNDLDDDLLEVIQSMFSSLNTSPIIVEMFIRWVMAINEESSRPGSGKRPLTATTIGPAFASLNAVSPTDRDKISHLTRATANLWRDLSRDFGKQHDSQSSRSKTEPNEPRQYDQDFWSQK